VDLFWILFLLILLWNAIGWWAFVPRWVRPGALRPFEVNGPLQDARLNMVGACTYRLRFGRWNCTWPLARLTANEKGVAVGSSTRWLRRVMPTWYFPWEQIDRIDAIKITMGRGRGVVLRPTEGGAPVAFGTPSGSVARILDYAQALGVFVDRTSGSTWRGL
jgi:hypothetical protein